MASSSSSSNMAPGKSSENFFSIEMSSEERLTSFVKYFVTELESTLVLHYNILEGNIEDSGQMPELIGTALGVFVNTYIGITTKSAAKLFQWLLKKPFEVVEKNKSLEYYEIVYRYKRSKTEMRQLFVNIGIDVFRSFEYQFIGINSTRGPNKAIQRFARDAAYRFMNGLKSEGESYSENPILCKIQKGWTKLNKSVKPQLPAPKANYEMNAQKVLKGKSKPISDFIPDMGLEKLKPGFDIRYKCRESHEECKKIKWNTSDLFDQVGIAEEKEGLENYVVYETNKSNCEIYGYRHLFPDEEFDFGEPVEKCSKTCMHPQYLNYIDYTSQSNRIFELINDDDEVEVRQRTLKLTKEMKKDFDQLKNTVDKQHSAEQQPSDSDYCQLLKTIVTFNDQLTDIIAGINKILEELKSVRKDFNANAQRNEEHHQNHAEKLLKIEEHLKVPYSKNTVEQNIKKKRILFQLQKPVKTFEGRITEMEDLHQALMKITPTQISQAATIVGLGGIGKTELAKKYVDEYKESYHNIIFIDAEKSESISKSFKKLAEQIGIPFTLKKQDGSQIREIKRDINNVVDDIYKRLNVSGKTLMVFDNAEECKYIKKFIFNDSSDNNCIYTLITSRCTIWEIGEMGNIKVIKLKEFTEEEAMDYLNKTLENENEDDLKSLMNLLQRFPLALEQAVGYIEQENIREFDKKNGNIGIKNYLEEYKENKRKLLKMGHHENDDIYRETIATTWIITMKKIEKKGKCGKLALSILKIVAYLAPNNIDYVKIFSKLEKDVDKLNEAIFLIRDYSMISNDKGKVSVHRLVQEAVQIHLAEMKQEEEVLKKTLKFLKTCDSEEHIVSVWEHSSKYAKIVKKFYNNSKYVNLNQTPIHIFASHRNDIAAIEEILKHVKCREDDLNTALHIACRHGNTNLVKFLIGKGADVSNKTDWWQQTPLHTASESGNDKIMQMLVFKGVDVNEADKDGNTPLHIAALSNKLKSLECLLKLEANQNIKNKAGNTAFHCLLIKDAEEGFEFFLSKGDNFPNQDDRKLFNLAVRSGSVKIMSLLFDQIHDINVTDEEGNTLLHIAALCNQPEATKFLLNMGADANRINEKGKTALHYIAEKGAEDEFILLMSKGLDPNIRDKSNRSPLHYATIEGNLKIMQILIDKRVDMNVTDKDGNSPLLLAAEYNKIEALKLLLKSGADVNARNSKGTALHYSVRRGAEVECKFLLLSKELDPNIRDKSDLSPLHYAVIGGNLKIMQLLIDKGVDVNVTDKDGNSPLLLAAEYNKIEALKLLLKSGADPKTINSEGKSILHYIAGEGTVDEFKLILSKQLDPNIRDKSDRSLLHYAAIGGNVKILQLLIDKGVDINVTDQRGYIPLHLAAFNGEFETLKYLLKNGADPKIVSKLGETVLHAAAYKCDIVAFKFIMELNFDLTVVDKVRNSLLHYAVHGGNKTVIEFLIKKGMDPDITDSFGFTPLHYISTTLINDLSTYEAITLLIKLGANPNAVCKFNRTPLHLASIRNNHIAAQELIVFGANINSSNKLGRSALHYATAKCHWDIIDLLLEKGAEVNVYDLKGRSPLHHLSRNGKFKLVKLLLIYGADPRILDKAGHSLLHLAAVHFRYRAVEDFVKNVNGTDVNARDVDGKTPLHLAAECGRVAIVGLLVRHGAETEAKDRNGNTPLDSAAKLNRVKVVDFFNSSLQAIQESQ
ncbi:uncharacterized protein LOC143913048 [Arctopsyche grandis]|uniref:uncharacterized protein LOC143913048 n=1 Tax=Arctopsyche grandis TaxID=121162 RepID=UPI00406D7406